MSVLNRAMFRVPGQQSRGIMRSSPELIRVSTANASQLNPTITGAPEFKVGNLNSGITRIPFYGKIQPGDKSNREIEAADSVNYNVIPVDTKTYGAIPGTSAITEEVGSGNPTKINDVTKKILEKNR